MRKRHILSHGLILVISILAAGIAAADSASRIPGVRDLEVKELEFDEDLVLGLDREAGTFGEIAGVVVDSEGAIHVLDRGFSCVHKFAADGTYLDRYGSEGEGPGDFRQAASICIDGQDRVYVAGMGRTISVFDAATGALLDTFRRTETTLDSPVYSMRVDDQGNVFMSCVDVLKQTVLFKYEPGDFTLVRSFGTSYAVGHDVDTRMERVFAGGYIDMTRDGRLLYAQRTPPAMFVYDTEGRLLETVETRGADADLPEATADGNSITFYTPDLMSGPVLAMSGGGYLTTVLTHVYRHDAVETKHKRTAIVDLYDADGHLIKSVEKERMFIPQYADAANRIYVSETRHVNGYEYPVMARYVVH